MGSFVCPDVKENDCMIIIYTLLLALYYANIQAANVGPERKKYKPFTLAALLIFSSYIIGHDQHNIWGVLVIVSLSLEDFWSEQGALFLFKKFIAQLLIVLFVVFGMSTNELLIILPLGLILFLPLFTDRVSALQAVQLSLGLVGIFSYSLISFESFTVLNPSFVLPESIIPSDYFYDDFKAPLLSFSFLITGLSLLNIYKNNKEFSSLLFVYMALVFSLINGLGLDLINIKDMLITQTVVAAALLSNVAFKKTSKDDLSFLVISWGLFVVYIGTGQAVLGLLAFMSSVCFLITNHLLELFESILIKTLLEHLRYVFFVVICLYGAFISSAYIISYLLFILIIVFYLIFCYERHSYEESV